PGSDGYDGARRIFNAMIDRRPALIARCERAADVVACVGFARAHGLDVSVKGGGHNVSGKAVCEGGLMIDLSLMKGVRVDAQRRTVRAEAGLTLGELDRECQAFGLATPTGNVWPIGRAPRVLAFYDELARGCPDELCVNAGFGLAEDRTLVLGVAVAYVGDLDAGERLLKPLRSLEHPIAAAIGPMSYVDLQRGGDGGFPNGRRHYWKGGFLRRLGSDVIDVLTYFATTCPSAFTQIGLQQMHGAAARVAPT